MVSSWGSLAWILDQAVTGGRASPENIPKMIIFIDDLEVLTYILLRKNADILDEKAVRITKVIRPYFTRGAEYDKDQTFAEFKDEKSKTRIIFAITSLGIGVNIIDVKYVIYWRFPISFNMLDTYQKAGRGGRGPGYKSTVILYLDY
ncbi:hypothetical protein PMAA_007730 [Talaromyces marneffei ATCC 18224]|uniref:Helicase C-terminal domain-containing protein n=1 Tax=Talaromyces marneffei (strain ATCC 18224 / CBS 334.59 / QM 7333) TaxID=441960 RepID=B6QU46_TALMQ|nr:hypothetical protein PMAA_007730 [Talaromyces marneffei ATCC 18224]